MQKLGTEFRIGHSDVNDVFRGEGPRAFTLIELLVVIAIIGVLVGILMPAVTGMKTKAKTRQAEAEVKSLAMALRAYHTEYNDWPVTNQDRVTLSSDNIIAFSKLVASGNPHKLNFIELTNTTINPANSLRDPFGTNGYYVVTISVTNNSVTVRSPSVGVEASY